ncbi:MAG: hypothetical protein FJW53_07365 [Actinobacteria bacterium]|nr:hypothetical protein [Actinomycetota bacterium]
MSWRDTIRVKYHECDMQSVVFNANYWVYVDDLVAQWMRHAIGVANGPGASTDNVFANEFDFMLKKAEGTWHKGATYGDTIEARCGVSRWGKTSFDVAISLSVRGEPCFDAVITYVSVTPRTHSPCPVPDKIKMALDSDHST